MNTQVESSLPSWAEMDFQKLSVSCVRGTHPANAAAQEQRVSGAQPPLSVAGALAFVARHAKDGEAALVAQQGAGR